MLKLYDSKMMKHEHIIEAVGEEPTAFPLFSEASVFSNRKVADNSGPALRLTGEKPEIFGSSWWVFFLRLKASISWTNSQLSNFRSG